MQIRFGYELVYERPKPTPMLLALNVRFTRIAELLIPDHVITSPKTPTTGYRDGFASR